MHNLTYKHYVYLNVFTNAGIVPKDSGAVNKVLTSAKDNLSRSIINSAALTIDPLTISDRF